MDVLPAKIMDVQCLHQGIGIRVNGRCGSGDYFPGDPEELEAIIVGVCGQDKFLMSENYSSSLSRHIPDDVKREVWDRDGGHCVHCQATDYLEFDHIIPHASGGANTVKNVQILCRRCNGEKSDRI